MPTPKGCDARLKSSRRKAEAETDLAHSCRPDNRAFGVFGDVLHPEDLTANDTQRRRQHPANVIGRALHRQADAGANGGPLFQGRVARQDHPG
jgi:hypothetical protein